MDYHELDHVWKESHFPNEVAEIQVRGSYASEQIDSFIWSYMSLCCTLTFCDLA